MRIVFRLERDDGTLLLPERSASVLPGRLPLRHHWRAQRGNELVCERTFGALTELVMVVETTWIRNYVQPRRR